MKRKKSKIERYIHGSVGHKLNPKYVHRMRNPSKNTIKKLMRPANGGRAGWGHRNSNYTLFNEVGAAVYNVSKGQICNREPKGHERYLLGIKEEEREEVES